MVSMKWCSKCSNTGIDIDGNPCTCRFNAQTFYESVSCMDVPEQYQGVTFNSALVPRDVDPSYAVFLQKLFDDVSTGKTIKQNMCICSPVGHSKNVFAYSCIEMMFRHGIPTFPVYDILEAKRLLLDTDFNRKPLYPVENPENLTLTPNLFIKVPRVITWEVYDTMVMILDRRMRRGNYTIFLYDGNWGQLVALDKNEIVTSLMGDGNFNTLAVRSWSLLSKSQEVQMPVDDSLG